MLAPGAEFLSPTVGGPDWIPDPAFRSLAKFQLLQAFGDIRPTSINHAVPLSAFEIKTKIKLQISGFSYGVKDIAKPGLMTLLQRNE